MPPEDFNQLADRAIDQAKQGDNDHLIRALDEVDWYMRLNPKEANAKAQAFLTRASEEKVLGDIVQASYSRGELKRGLDLNGDDKVLHPELARVESTPYLKQRLSPLQQATLGYVDRLSGGGELTNKQITDAASRGRFIAARDRYSTTNFIQKVDDPTASSGKADGSLTDVELKAEQARTAEKLRTAESGELSPTVLQGYQDRLTMANYLQANARMLGNEKLPVSNYDIDEVGRTDNPNYIEIQPISFREETKWGSVEQGRSGYSSQLIDDYLSADNNKRFNQLDIDGNGKVSEHELNALRGASSSTFRERDLVDEIGRFQRPWNGQKALPKDFTLDDVHAFAKNEREIREAGKLATGAQNYFWTKNHSLDINGDSAITTADLRKVSESTHERLADDSLKPVERRLNETRKEMADYVKSLMAENKTTSTTEAQLYQWLDAKVRSGDAASRYIEEFYGVVQPADIPYYEAEKAARDKREKESKKTK
jgi:hypothetical protein